MTTDTIHVPTYPGLAEDLISLAGQIQKLRLERAEAAPQLARTEAELVSRRARLLVEHPMDGKNEAIRAAQLECACAEDQLYQTLTEIVWRLRATVARQDAEIAGRLDRLAALRALARIAAAELALTTGGD